MPFELKIHFLGAVTIMMIRINSVVKAGGEILWESRETRIALINTKSKYLRKRFRACREIRIYLNSVFYFEKSTCWIYMYSLINNTINVVLAF